jgi:hypothetical protein
MNNVFFGVLLAVLVIGDLKVPIRRVRGVWYERVHKGFGGLIVLSALGTAFLDWLGEHYLGQRAFRPHVMLYLTGAYILLQLFPKRLRDNVICEDGVTRSEVSEASRLGWLWVTISLYIGNRGVVIGLKTWRRHFKIAWRERLAVWPWWRRLLASLVVGQRAYRVVAEPPELSDWFFARNPARAAEYWAARVSRLADGDEVSVNGKRYALSYAGHNEFKATEVGPRICDGSARDCFGRPLANCPSHRCLVHCACYCQNPQHTEVRS